MYVQRKNLSPALTGLVLLISLLLAAASCTQAPVLPTAEEAEKAVLAREHAALDQWAAGNPIGLADIMAEDVTYFDDIAAHTRLDGIEELKKHLEWLDGKVPPHQYELIDPKVQVYGEVAILTLHYGPVDEEGNSKATWKATSVYNYRDGEWYGVHAHWSMIKAEEPAGEPAEEPAE